MTNAGHCQPAIHVVPSPLADVVAELIEQSPIEQFLDRRERTRQPFFGSATIFDQSGRIRLLSAFTRDISPFGIGLMHQVPLIPAEVIVMIHRPPRDPLRFVTRITWCEACSESWYLSGGRLLGLVDRCTLSPSE